MGLLKIYDKNKKQWNAIGSLSEAVDTVSGVVVLDENQQIQQNASTRVNFTKLLSIHGGDFVKQNNMFRCIVQGAYQFNMQITTDISTEGTLSVVKNGVVFRTTRFNSVMKMAQLSCQLYLKKEDLVSIFVTTDNNCNIDKSDNLTYMDFALLQIARQKTPIIVSTNPPPLNAEEGTIWVQI